MVFIDWYNRHPNYGNDGTDYDGTDYDPWAKHHDPDQWKWDYFNECQRNRKWRFPPVPWWETIPKPDVWWFKLKNHPTIFSN